MSKAPPPQYLPVLNISAAVPVVHRFLLCTLPSPPYRFFVCVLENPVYRFMAQRSMFTPQRPFASWQHNTWSLVLHAAVILLLTTTCLKYSFSTFMYQDHQSYVNKSNPQPGPLSPRVTLSSGVSGPSATNSPLIFRIL